MPTPEEILDNAKRNFGVFAATQEVFLVSCKSQLDHAKQVAESALSGNYTAAAGIADITALWVNGVATMLSAFGYIPAGTRVDENGGEPTPPPPTPVVPSPGLRRGQREATKGKQSTPKATKKPRKAKG